VVDFIGYFFLKLSRDDILETLSFSAPGCRRKESTANYSAIWPAPTAMIDGFALADRAETFAPALCLRGITVCSTRAAMVVIARLANSLRACDTLLSAQD
jgi:hypothetical protein